MFAPATRLPRCARNDRLGNWVRASTCCWRFNAKIPALWYHYPRFAVSLAPAIVATISPNARSSSHEPAARLFRYVLAPGRRPAAGPGCRGADVRPHFVSPPRLFEANSAPAAPTGLTAAHNGETVTATWVPPTGATKYHITYSTDGMNSWSGPSCGDNCTASGTETEASFTITGTDPGKTYVVGLRAGNQHGWSTWVNSAPAEAPNPPPDTPGPIIVTRSDGQLHVSWPADSNAIKYHVTYSSDHMNSWSATLCGDNCSGNEITIVGVDNDKTYYVGVRAGNGSGWSGWRNSDAVLPFLTPPDPPTNLQIQRICDHHFQVWWDHMPRRHRLRSEHQREQA